MPSSNHSGISQRSLQQNSENKATSRRRQFSPNHNLENKVMMIGYNYFRNNWREKKRYYRLIYHFDTRVHPT